MTEDASSPTPSDPQATAVATAAQLAAARERLGMGKGEVAQRLKLNPRQLDAIERGDWEALPGRAFVRGCVRSYGRLLGLDVEPLLQSIGGFAEAESLKPTSTLAAPLPRGGGFGFDGEGHRSKLPWAVLGVIGVIAVALFFGRDGDVSKVTSWIGKTDGPSSAPAPLASPASGAATAPAASGADTGSTALQVPPPLVPATPPPVAVPPPPPVVVAPPPPPPPPPPLRFIVKQDSWVDVRQADGKSVFMGTIKPGAPQDVKGDAPFTLTIGNASVVTLEFEGKPVDLKPSTIMPNNIAKLKLP